MVDYSEDQRIGKTILATTTDAYRKLRNTTRYLLGALAGFDEAERVTDYDQFPPLEKYILHRLWELDGQVKAAYEAYRFSDVIRPLIDFCQGDLSSLFFDIRKDSLYCDAPTALRRRAYRTVLDYVFERLTVWLSPLTSFTMEEAWTTRFPEAGSNVLRVMPERRDEWKNEAEAERWREIISVRDVVNLALEKARNEKLIGSALEAHPVVYLNPRWGLEYSGKGPDTIMSRFATSGISPEQFAAETFITSSASFVLEAPPAEATLHANPNVGVVIAKADGKKCARSWRILPEVGTDPRYPELSLRDAEAVAWWDAHHPASA
jgi:isoleucyl-tRNA synthetase